ncbi:protein-glutamine gamma-glutamyltransferase [Cohnella algarum]|uniref:protein-glutamine gamma-glutamyltransferase n=1 Tax=Cohnella algarum TaxID=2044859 RepID=UPI0019685FBC|nr:protein-glutamine gamma-glutamyltransferase [Cohnella algarum]MBN2981857.1 protein-glutamine gamma-glutamyltransferase [Cohnella algarum]
MIVIAGGSQPVDASGLSALEREIVRQKERSATVYRYASAEALLFELMMRSAIVAEAQALNESGVGFASFEKSRCNERYWTRNEMGGFRLRDGVTPAEGLRDIFVNGPAYAFECATAIVIVLYKAILDMKGDAIFNAYFPNLLLYDWHYDNDLRFIRNDGEESFPGDVLYFRNPDHDPDRPEWQGENVVKLGDDLYYGHGVGIGSAETMISALNRARRPGSDVSAYMEDLVLLPDFEYIRRLNARTGRRTGRNDRPDPIVARIGVKRYRF